MSASPRPDAYHRAHRADPTHELLARTLAQQNDLIENQVRLLLLVLTLLEAQSPAPTDWTEPLTRGRIGRALFRLHPVWRWVITSGLFALLAAGAWLARSIL